MKTPASGAPSATPPVRAEPYQPIASPRRSSGTRSATFSEAADRTGAQRSPGRNDEQRQRPGVRARTPWARSARPCPAAGGWRDRPVHGSVDQAADHRCGAPEEEHDADFALVPAVSRTATLPTSDPLSTMPGPGRHGEDGRHGGSEPAEVAGHFAPQARGPRRALPAPAGTSPAAASWRWAGAEETTATSAACRCSASPSSVAAALRVGGLNHMRNSPARDVRRPPR